MALRKPRTPSPPPALTPFDARVARVVRAIPVGRTRSYGQVAMLAGTPGAPRAVVQALRRITDVPWWRVVRADGSIAPQMMPEQAEHLRAEGARVVGRKVVVDVVKGDTAGPRARAAAEGARRPAPRPRAGRSR